MSNHDMEIAFEKQYIFHDWCLYDEEDNKITTLSCVENDLISLINEVKAGFAALYKRMGKTFPNKITVRQRYGNKVFEVSID